MFGLRVASLTTLLWTIFVLTRTSKRLRMLPHSQTFILMIFQVFADVGGTIYCALDSYNVSLTEAKYPLYLIRSMGNYGARFNTALIGISLYMITHWNSDLVFKVIPYLQIVGMITPMVFSVVILAIKQDDILDHYIARDPDFGFKDETIVALTVLVICVLITMI